MLTRSQQAHVLAERLERDRQAIIDRWLNRVQARRLAGRSMPTPELVDNLPAFLDQLAAALRRGASDDERAGGDAPTPTTQEAREHGTQRYRHGLDIRAVVDEYASLLDVLFDLFAETEPSLDVDNSRVLVHAVSTGLAAAVDQFSREREADVEAAQEALLKAREYERQLIGVVSHDLRNPLAVIVHCAELIHRTPHLAGSVCRPLGRLRSSAERALRLIGDLLDFTQERNQGRIPVKPAAADLRLLLRQVIDEATLIHPCRAVERAGPDVRMLGWWDPDRIAQVLTNLLDNAFKFSPPDSVVRVAWDMTDDEAKVSVHNWGDPIPPERLGSVFEPFQRADPDANARVSLGLGLHISRQIALAHRGNLTVESSAEAGTCFTLTLPRSCSRGEAG
ncbi:Signal transduction histidine kinase [Nannocystis exedens]|uniref:histidine kinase n=1 Tax=Nannocystis exedens TaxID=54 RepID=A0A1I2E3A8_9BACT|nr:sensor histidine kinase [Nannocystis exedens]PCC69242.1 hybrid sensor histidine kinase/response regulator [Nannocystis exedens]SFE87048.1 Signal transduction histidine kinase [Nannocystis exedens]